MKRLLVLMLVAALVAVPLVGCTPDDEEDPNGEDNGEVEDPNDEDVGLEDDSTLIIGSPELTGDYVAGFGNSAYDRWVRDLIWGYATYVITPDGETVLNETVVADLDTEEDSEGNKTYTFTIHDDLVWNDGETITAEDYVFNVLWNASPAWVEAGATSSVGDSLIGYGPYNEGEFDRFPGVELVDEFTFSATIDAEELPYFYETSFVSIAPFPMHYWMPDAELDHNEDGTRIHVEGSEYVEREIMEIEEDEDGEEVEVGTGEFVRVNDAMLEAMENVATVERFTPEVTCGPFNFVSFENNAATVERNDLYKGNFEGKTPQLETIVVRSINQTTDIDMVISGEVHAITGVIEGEKIERGISADTTDVNFYPRNGFGGVYFHCDFGPTKDATVRRALGFLMDRDEIIANVLGGYGSVTNGYYGLAQWMYQEKQAEVDQFPHMTRDIEHANELLDETEWIYEEDGTTPFDPSKQDTDDTGYYRHNADGEPLVINHFGTEDNEVTDNVELQFRANAHLAGIDWNVSIGDFDALLDNFYYGFQQGDDREYHSFNLATTWTAVFDPYYGSLHSDYAGSWVNSNQIADDELDATIEKMRRLDPTETDLYADYWLEFQERYVELMPTIPLYSNQYYDIFRTEVKGFNTTPFNTWAEVVCDIYIEN